ncbi:hypothetical protein J3459_016326 [Metarhizium acridum]|nr:hypothetical protein J3459_016326 [Metarhizium acridum]
MFAKHSPTWGKSKTLNIAKSSSQSTWFPTSHGPAPAARTSLAETRHSVQDHEDATFKRLGRNLKGPIRFTATRVIVDAEREEDGWWCTVETKGEATRTTGQPYDNEYAWLMRWNDEGKIVEVRSYFDTMLSEKVLLGQE